MSDATPEPFWTAANMLSLSRIPMAGLVWVDPTSAPLLLGLMVLAGWTDVMDGWVARRQRDPDPPRDPQGGIGTWLDPLCDKVFVLSAMVAVWVGHDPPLWILPLIAARELIQVALMALGLVVTSLRERLRRFDFTAAVVGKAATVGQFTTVAAIVLWPAWVTPAALATGATSVAAGLYYVWRVTKMGRPRPDPA
jgi:phosphatidylglycerophosphate synthase